MRGLVTLAAPGEAPSDVLVTGPSWDLPAPPGGVLGPVDDVTELPFGLVEVVVLGGRGAGAVRRLEVGRFRCGPDPEDDVHLPEADARWILDVRCGGVVYVQVDDARGEVWPIGERRVLGGLDLVVRWCRGPQPDDGPRAVRGLPLADVLLDHLAGVAAAGGAVGGGGGPTWEFGRDEDGDVVDAALTDHPLLTISGPQRHAAARAVLGRMVASSGPDNVRLTVLAPARWGNDRVRQQHAREWSWVRWLPHARCPGDRFVRVGLDDDACSEFVAEAVGASSEGEPWQVVVVDGRVGDVDRIVRPGLAVLVLDEAPEQSGLRVSTEEPARVDGPGMPGLPVDLDLPGRDWIEHLARSLATAEDHPPGMPASGRLADLLSWEPDDHQALARCWTGPATTVVPIGWGAGGEPVSVDLRTDGPHALIAGTTGAGKSELLQTLVAGLAALNPPESMTFVLVDYKGGAAFAGCARLPHTLGVVTDLDARLTERALASLSAEIRRRERLLADVEAPDIDAYVAAGAGPLARLVIVVDEFATLAAELPEFVDGLVDIARRGRSLGLHLVLATQRPAGVVSADIRANTTLRIALRVAEVADSTDVLGLPDAVDIDERSPGRGLVRVGQNRPLLVQTARVTTAAPEAGRVPFVFGEPVRPPATAPRPDLAVLTQTASQLVSERGLDVPPSPWLPPLPTDIGIDDLPAVDEAAVPFGIEDRPSEQRQSVTCLSLDAGVPLAVVGAAKSGRTGVLRALVASATRCFSPEDLHIYGIDAGSRGLVGLEEAPHAGAIVARDELDRLDRLVDRLRAEMDNRVETLALRRWRDHAEQRAVDPESPWPYVLLVVDRWDVLVDILETAEDRTLISALERLAAEGDRVGFTVAVTGDRTMLVGRSATLFPDRLVLRLSDPYDYTAVGLPGPAGHGEPGRGWRGDDIVETQAADAGDPQVVVRADDLARSPDTGRGPFRIDVLPRIVTRDQADGLVGSTEIPSGALLVAVGGDTLGPRWIDPEECGQCFLVTGRRRSGRSGVLMTLAESALSQDWDVAVVVARRSPLTTLSGPNVYGPFRRDEDAPDLAEAVRRSLEAGRRILVLADDVDLLLDGPLSDELTDLPTTLRDTGSVVAGSGEAEEMAGAFRGPAFTLRRGRCGVMLAPQGAEDGEVFGVRLRRGQYGRPLGVGAGYLVIDAWPERVQVVRSNLLPEPRIQ